MKANPYVAIVGLAAGLTLAVAASLVGTAAVLALPFLALGSLYGSFNLVIFLASYFYGRSQLPRRTLVSLPKVTVIYATCNDFDERAFDSVVGLEYPRTEVLILDDSTRSEVRTRVDRAASRHGVTVVRRGNRRGFKAGAINDILPSLDSEYFSIVDADEIVPADFLDRALEYFVEDRIAFVQASHYAYNRATLWTGAMGHGVDLHWKVYQKYRNSHGVVNFLGHGAVLRTDAVRAAGGFPEIVSEDIALTVELARMGMRGVFADDLVCGEAFPESFTAFRRRHKKWAMGTAQFLRLYLARILTAPLTWYERLDLLLPALSLPMTVFLSLFIVMAHFVPIPVTPPLLALSFLAMGAPLLPFFTLPRGRRLPALLVNSVAFMSLFTISVLYVVRGALGRAVFLVTGDRTARSRAVDVACDVSMGFALLSLHPLNLLGMVALGTPLLMLLFDRPRRDARSSAQHGDSSAKTLEGPG